VLGRNGIVRDNPFPPDHWRIKWRAEADETENYTYAIALENDI
jgi:hypothetical protein